MKEVVDAVVGLGALVAAFNELIDATNREAVRLIVAVPRQDADAAEV